MPVTRELYWASQNDGAYKVIVSEDGTLGSATKMHVSTERDMDKVRVVMSSSHGCPQMDSLIEKYGFKHFKKMGSSLKGCLIASGEAEIYYRYNPTMEWDTAAMQCIIEEAGGIFRQIDGSEMLYNREDSLNSKGFYAINCFDNELS